MKRSTCRGSGSIRCYRTHGGQAVLPVVGQPIMPSKFGQKYRTGLVRDGARQTFIGNGLGHLTAPTRFNFPPEVAPITLG